jgi:hypothetical protein
LRFDLKCSRTNVYAPLLNRIGALSLNVIWDFETTYSYNSLPMRWNCGMMEYWDSSKS